MTLSDRKSRQRHNVAMLTSTVITRAIRQVRQVFMAAVWSGRGVGGWLGGEGYSEGYVRKEGRKGISGHHISEGRKEERVLVKDGRRPKRKGRNTGYLKEGKRKTSSYSRGHLKGREKGSKSRVVKKKEPVS